MTTTTAENKQLVGRYLQALSGQAKTRELVARFVDDAALAEHIHHIEAAFPAYEIIVDEMIAERDIVALRATFQGTQRGSFNGVPATGRAVSAGLMIFYRVAGNRIVEHWMQFDGASLMSQLQATAPV